MSALPVAAASIDYLAETFGEGGHIARRLPGYLVRPMQIDMAMAVDRAIEERRHLLVEGPTGVGKSLAYLVPAIRRAVQANKKVVVATRNILLMKQLLGKDLPFLTVALPDRFSYASLKGKQRYLCKARYSDVTGRPQLVSVDDSEQDEIVDRWAQHTVAGDFDELDFDITKTRLLPRYAVSAEDCDGRRCRQFLACHYYAAKKKAAQAHIVVTNYHLLFSHLAYGQVLPEFDVLICDEAHELEKIAQEFFGYEIRPGAITRLVKALGKAADDDPENLEQKMAKRLQEDLTETSKNFFAAVMRYRESHDYERTLAGKRSAGRLRRSGVADPEPLAGALKAAGEAFWFCSEAAGNEAENYPVESDDYRDARELERHYDRLANRAAEIAQQLRDAMALKEPAKHIYLLGEKGTPWVEVTCRLITVAETLDHALFNIRNEGAQADSRPIPVILTSATLAAPDALGQPSFAFNRQRLGISAFNRQRLGISEADEFVAPSPFNLREQALLVASDLAPTPPTSSGPERAQEEREYRDSVARIFQQVIELTNGRTLGLFTSWASLNHVWDAIQQRSEPFPFRIMRQGEMPNEKLVQTFREDVHSTLLGVDSFWAGVDVPGEALSCVIIEKIPFGSSKIDPILDALEEQHGFGKVFDTYTKPRSLLQLRQAFGRLIRTTTDRGVCVVLDSRLIAKPYSRQFLAAFGGARRAEEIERIRSFLDISNHDISNQQG